MASSLSSSSSSSLKFTVRRCQPQLVPPAIPTPHELKLLSDIDDQQALRFHFPMIQIYGKQASMAEKDPVEVIRQALSQTLVFYYPFAGRLREGPHRKLMVDCTGEGVMFIEADADVTLAQFGDSLQPPFPCFHELLYDVPGSQQITNTPLLLVQEQPNLPLHQYGRELLMARDPPRITCNHREYEQVQDTLPSSNHNLVQRSFFFGPLDIAALRKSIPQHLHHCSTFDLITACLWRCRTKAMQIEADEVVRMTCTINARGRFNPPLPVGYYGNCFAYPAAVTSGGKLCGNPFGYAVDLINKVKDEMKEEYLQSVADLMSRDFGWGEAVYGGVAQAGAGSFPWASHFCSAKNGKGEEGITFSICLPVEAMERFAKEFDHMLRNQNQPQRTL
ncbi:hypothetical protein VNO80_29662 [Phaseolus coccineus]|uniref:Benzyl alcohol O-benzoyltransferase n=1 Tax=Phaseolus coccineus TaxID=3886 RepID=A0AAN9LCH4_PHACN